MKKKPSEMTDAEIIQRNREVLARAAREGLDVAFGAPIKVELKSSPRRIETFVRPPPPSPRPFGLTDSQMQICAELNIDPARYAAVRDGRQGPAAFGQLGQNAAAPPLVGGFKRTR